MKGLAPFLLAWRTVSLRDREVVDAIVHPAHAGPSAELARALEGWRGPRYWSDELGFRHLVLIRSKPKGRERWSRHIILLVLTLALALHARLRIIPRLSPERLPTLALHIVLVTILAVLFVVVGVGFRTGGIL